MASNVNVALDIEPIGPTDLHVCPCVVKVVFEVYVFNPTIVSVTLVMLEQIVPFSASVMAIPIVPGPTNSTIVWNVIITLWDLNVNDVNPCLLGTQVTMASVCHALSIAMDILTFASMTVFRLLLLANGLMYLLKI